MILLSIESMIYSAVHYMLHKHIRTTHTHKSPKALEFSFWKHDMFWWWILLVLKGLDDEWGLYHVADASVYEIFSQSFPDAEDLIERSNRQSNLKSSNFWANCNSKTWIKDILGNKIQNNHHTFVNFPTGSDWSRWNLPRVICCWIRFVMPCLLLRLLTFKLLEFPHPFQAQGTFLAGLVLMMMKRMARTKKCGVMTSVAFLIYKNSQGICKERLQFQYRLTNVSFSAPKIPVDPFEKWNAHPKCWGDDWGILGGEDPELKWIKNLQTHKRPTFCGAISKNHQKMAFKLYKDYGKTLW